VIGHPTPRIRRAFRSANLADFSQVMERTGRNRFYELPQYWRRDLGFRHQIACASATFAFSMLLLVASQIFIGWRSAPNKLEQVTYMKRGGSQVSAQMYQDGMPSGL
jgi:hypothetical protein